MSEFTAVPSHWRGQLLTSVFFSVGVCCGNDDSAYLIKLSINEFTLVKHSKQCPALICKNYISVC